jgi:hypothetical protein
MLDSNAGTKRDQKYVKSPHQIKIIPYETRALDLKISLTIGGV